MAAHGEYSQDGADATRQTLKASMSKTKHVNILGHGSIGLKMAAHEGESGPAPPILMRSILLIDHEPLFGYPIDNRQAWI